MKYKPWDESNHEKALNDLADYIKTGGEVKINPESIEKVGLVPIYVISPRMAVKREWDGTQKLKEESPSLSVWINERLKKQTQEVKEIKTESDEKLEKINTLAISLMEQEPPERTTKRQLLIHLKKIFGFNNQ